MHRRDYLKLAVASSSSTLFLCGCLNLAGEDGDGDTTTSDGPMSPSTQASVSPTSEAPTVTNPLDVSELKANPCTALSSEQVQKLGVKPKRDSGSSGPICEYEYTGSVNNEFNIMLTDNFDNGLADIYARKPNLAYFEPTQVAGYPAVYAGSFDRRNDGDCTLHVGLTDTFAPGIFAQLNGGTDYSRPCTVVEKVARAMIKHLKVET